MLDGRLRIVLEVSSLVMKLVMNIEEQVCDWIWSRFRKTDRSRDIWDQVNKQVWDQVNELVFSPISHEVWAVSRQIRGRVSNQLK